MNEKQAQGNRQEFTDQDGRVFMGYKKSQVEGQCIMLEISPIKLILWKFIIFCICNILICIPLLLTMWFPKLKRIFYYQFCSYEELTDFYIVNYDEGVSIVEKGQKVFMKSEDQGKFYTYFVNRYMTYIIDDSRTVTVNTFGYNQKIARIINSNKRERGLTQSQAHQIQNSYGPGTMIIPDLSLVTIILGEILRPLYMFLIFSVSYWFFRQKYYYFAACLFFISLVGLVINIVQIKSLNKKIHDMAFHQLTLNVLREGIIKPVSSIDVVPGDIVFLKDPIKLTFEGIILEGSALINQCALTGESVPIVKKADTFANMANLKGSIDKSAFVYEGTTIVQVNDKKKMSKFEEFRGKFGIPCCVIRTNFVTTKGQLIRIILFPKDQQNIFQRQSAKFLFFLFGLATISFIIIAFLIRQWVPGSDLAQKYIDIITITVPPGLPVSMTFGIIYAVERLQQKGIFCVSQNKVIDGGMIEFSCFDKTGTLTQDFMDFYALVPSNNGKFDHVVINTPQNCDKCVQRSAQSKYLTNILTNMAANHSIIKIQETNELVGDPMEIKTFLFGQYQLNQSHSDHEVIFAFESKRGHSGVIFRRFQFDADLQRMSVICKNNSSQKCQILVKGSPQMMQTLITSASTPSNYKQTLKDYASRGFRVLALGSKQIDSNDMKTISRQDAQSNLTFNGFQVFENKLKPQTKGAISQLKKAEIGCVMITGDNTLTGSNISYKCNISNKNKKMIIVDFVDKKFTEEDFHYIKDEQQDYQQNNSQTQNRIVNQSEFASIQLKVRDKNSSSMLQKPSDAIIHQNKVIDSFINDDVLVYMEKIVHIVEQKDLQLCVTGRAFDQMFKGNIVQLHPIQTTFMKYVTVFARTKPNDKAKIVTAYQHMGLKVSMCGDGANDCGALKQADIGLSLSQAEASISAPFTSKIANISSMVELIIECRGGLATNFSLFNIMAIYSLIQYTTTLVSQKFLQYPQDFHFLYWDLGLNFIYIIFIGNTKTASKLSIEKPRSSLFCFTNLLQIMLAFGIQLAGHISVIAIFQAAEPDYYMANGGMDKGIANFNEAQDFSPGLQNSLLFVFINNMYVASMITFNIAKPWRQYLFTNIPLMCSIAITLFYNHVVFFWYNGSYVLHYVKDYIPQNQRIRWILCGTSWGFCLAFFVVIKFILEPISAKLIRAYPHLKWL